MQILETLTVESLAGSRDTPRGELIYHIEVHAFRNGDAAICPDQTRRGPHTADIVMDSMKRDTVALVKTRLAAS
jgi:hypothetical protein